ncbi:uncharacterized protein LOC113359200 [Papaver somniferum]|uniref:uncharacterized protein LOC113359200 n=1 Tax=Papaver somniferum TaxID=3469 RepID=UPI000E6FA4D5|nr:uncharacterized protein LOC113359200 [Papaver somniferum]
MVDSENVKKYCHHLPFDSWYFVPPVGKSGGLSFGYIEKSNVQVISSSLNMIHIVYDVTPRIKNCLISFVYGSLNISGMRAQWNVLSSITDDINRPWMLLGDFNFIMHVSEKQGGIAPNSLVPDFIRAKMSDLNLNEIFSFGNHFTWCNRRFRNTKELIFEKLDRGFMNDKWVSLLPQTRVTNLGRIYSDHSPILVNCFHLEKNLYIPYKIFKCWKLSPEFKDVLSNAWSKRAKGSRSFVMAVKLSNIKDDLQYWNDNSFGHIKKTIHKLNSEIEKLQPMPHNLALVLKDVKPIVSDEVNLSLVAIPTTEEIYATIKDMEPWKSPGPDGFPTGFFRDNWDIMSLQVIDHIQSFFKTKFLLRKLNYTFSALNAKSAFVSNRQIQDNIIISHEILHSFKRIKKRAKKGYMVIKLDLSKAFDRLEWVFTIEVFRKLGFSEDWSQIIFQRISSVSFSVLIKGSPGESFAPSRSIRQGDCLYPYIFILCMDILSQILLKAESDNKIHGFRIRKNSPSITHLFFADDYMLFSKASIVYARNLMQILNKFAKASGKAINFDKSGFFTSSNMHHKHDKLLSRTLGIKYLSSYEKYLGTPLFINRDRTRTFQFLTDKFYARLGNMKKTNLNVVGRTVVTKHVLSSLASYHMSCFPFAKKLTSKFDSIQRSFWWSKKNPRKAAYFRSWLDIGKYKSCGDKYFPNQNLLEIDKAADSSSWIWKGIVISISFLKMNIVIKINNGRSTRIWSSNWLSYSAAPPFSTNPNYLNYTFVYELIDQQQGSWNVGLLHNLFFPEYVVKISTIRLNLLCEDKIKWAHTKDGNFTIRSAYKVYTNDYCSFEDSAFWEKVWSINCLPKIRYFMWKVFSHMLLVNSTIHAYNNSIDSTCPLCKNDSKTVLHLFFLCPVVSHIWFALSLQHLISTDFLWPEDYFLRWFDIRIGPSPFPVGWLSIGSIVMWFIWKLRCEMVFQNVSINFDKVILNSRRMMNTYITPPTEIICRKEVKNSRTDVRHILFLDGSFKNFNMGVGLILCDVTGRIECSRSYFGLVQDAVSAEATALILAIS